MSRLPDISEDQLSEEQKPIFAELAAGRGVRGPFNAWLRIPEFADLAQKMGNYLRFRSSVSKKLIELAVTITARHFSAQYAFLSHSKQAQELGVSPDVISAIIERKRPEFKDTEEEAVFDFCQELNENHVVSDSSYQVVLDKFGEKGVVELIATCGYYTLVSMTLVATNVDVAEGVEPLLPD
jgi:4-carboxymuconolactone decarboxylase